MLCYNLGMSKEPREAMYSKFSHPHAGDPRVDPEARAASLLRARKPSAKLVQRRKLERETLGAGFFEPQQPIAAEALPIVNPEPELRERALSFEKGMPMFALRQDPVTEEIVIPRTMEQAESLFLGRLPMNLELKIDKSCLERGKRGGTVIKRVGKSGFGAFTIALYPTVDQEGNDVDIPVLADMTHKSSLRKNAVTRFRQETSSLFYYSSLPRVSSRGKS